jgi:hypothetical protein
MLATITPGAAAMNQTVAVGMESVEELVLLMGTWQIALDPPERDGLRPLSVALSRCLVTPLDTVYYVMDGPEKTNRELLGPKREESATLWEEAC